ncbi:MAG: NfeD family protein [Akkermansiaceae bacterium]
MNDPKLIWFLIGAGLLLLEFAAPGLVILFFGVGGIITSIACWLGLADSLQTQMIIFSIASLLCLFTLRQYVKSWFVGDSENEADEMSTEFIGQVVRVVNEIPGGTNRGKVELKGADWNATSTAPHAVGDMVTVIKRDGLNLIVE